MRRFSQVDVFTDELTLGNPVAVVHDADGLDDAQLAAFARWTNLSETTFLLPPTDPVADYRLRIFTTGRELPFAGHPTLGSARAWLAAGGVPHADLIVQECGAGLVHVRRDGERLAFAAPPLRRSGPVDDADLEPVLRGLRLDRRAVLDAAWADNGPGWLAVLLRDAEAVLAVEPDFGRLGTPDVGIVGRYAGSGPADVEVRAFADFGLEDPVTGSLNASIGQWLIGAGVLPERYVASQGTRLGRRGRVHVERIGGADGAGGAGGAGGQVWVGGDTVLGVSGTVAL
ncbi:PhzF family phenazine biosynthesis protein [uncultured Jatrophihabitans sp.]|uniref:PhzF family phenazine biosynthesis protein n=1 Tax=uncultured Jatrophihabitans sp. TaxID=1610747 RepID=UPI0035C989F7